MSENKNLLSNVPSKMKQCNSCGTLIPNTPKHWACDECQRSVSREVNDYIKQYKKEQKDCTQCHVGKPCADCGATFCGKHLEYHLEAVHHWAICTKSTSDGRCGIMVKKPVDPLHPMCEKHTDHKKNAFLLKHGVTNCYICGIKNPRSSHFFTCVTCGDLTQQYEDSIPSGCDE